MSNPSEFVIETGILKEYVGPGGDVTIPDSVTSIGNEAFEYCEALKSVTIPDSVTSIGSEAFSGCSSLMSITIPDSVTRIGYAAFKGCSSLTSVTIPAGVTSIGDEAFRDCSALTDAVIPETVKSIGEQAFFGCIGKEDSDGFSVIGDVLVRYTGVGGDIRIPERVTVIEGKAFAGCSALTGLNIPDSVSRIGSEAFSGCNEVTALRFPPVWLKEHGLADVIRLFSTGVSLHNNWSCRLDAPPFRPIFDGTARYSEEFKKLVTAYMKQKKIRLEIVEYLIRQNRADMLARFLEIWGKYSLQELDGFVALADQAKAGAELIAQLMAVKEKLFPPEKAAEAEEKKVELELGLREPSPEEFRELFRFTYGKDGVVIKGAKKKEGRLVIPERIGKKAVAEIEENAFANCAWLEEIILPRSLLRVGMGAFFNCRARLETPERAIRELFEQSFFSMNDSTLQAYRGPGGDVAVPAGTIAIADSAFDKCSEITSLRLPDSVKTIGSRAFSGCIGLTSLFLPDGVKKVGGWAFVGCSRLQIVSCPIPLVEASNAIDFAVELRGQSPRYWAFFSDGYDNNLALRLKGKKFNWTSYDEAMLGTRLKLATRIFGALGRLIEKPELAEETRAAFVSLLNKNIKKLFSIAEEVGRAEILRDLWSLRILEPKTQKALKKLILDSAVPQIAALGKEI